MKRKLMGIALIIFSPLVLVWSVGGAIRVAAAVLWDDICKYPRMVKGCFTKPKSLTRMDEDEEDNHG